MKNKKVFKAVGKSVVCTAMAAMMFTLTACNPVEGDGDQPEKLSAPQITLTDNVINWSAVANADGYEVIENSTTVCSQAETTYTIDKTQPGTYTYTVKATSTSESYATSDASNAVTYTVAPEEEQVTYTVEFKLDSITYDKQVVAEGEKAHDFEYEPAKPGYVFTEWLMDNGNPYDFNAPVTSNITLKAGWSAKTYDGYTVSFNTNGGSEIESQSVTIGGFINLTEAPTKEHFEFAGWYSDEALTEEFDIENTAVKKSMTLYAKWELADGVTGVEENTTWAFNGATSEENNYYVYNQDVNGSTAQFNGLDIDGTAGKVTARGSDTQINAGGKISFYVAGACTVTVITYPNYHGYSLNGTAATADTQNYTFYQAERVEFVADSTVYLYTIKVTYPEPEEVISVDTTWLFGESGVADTTNNVYAWGSNKQVQGGTDTFAGLAIDATASGAKISNAERGDQYAQFNNHVTLTFNAVGACTVTVNAYTAEYTVNGEAATAKEQSFEISRAGEVVIEATGTNTYIISVAVEINEASVGIPAGYEKVDTSCDFAALADANGDGTKLSAAITYGKFGFAAGLYFEKSKNDVNTQGKNITVTLSGLDGYSALSFTAAGASSSANVTLTVTNSANQEVYKWVAQTSSSTTEILLEGLDADTYTITTSTSCRISALKVTEYLEESSLASLKVDNKNTKFLINDAFTSSGLSATAVYGNGSTRSQTNVVIDSSSYDNTKTGEYYIRVFYTENGETVTATYAVKVYSVEEISIGTYTSSSGKQVTLAQVYTTGGTFSTNGLTVTAIAYCGEDTYNVVLTSSQYSITKPDLTTVGEKTVTITANANEKATASFTVNVVDKAAVENNSITVTVDPSKAVSSTNFHTITDAITYLGNYDNNVAKTVQIADGEYKEKVFINIPKVTLIGSATNTPDATTNNGVVIWFDAIAGMADPAGTTYGTSGSGTVTVGASATEFVARNITFKNYYNTNELYNASKKISGDTQAVALHIESTSASFYNCKMTGYHDTLLCNKGNHYFKNCWIEGRTDYIFGQTAISYFDTCTIYTVSAGTQDGDGGYVAAFKHTAGYYVVFNGCDFTGPESGATGIALGRPWGADMKMITINSTISANYSTAKHTSGTSKGQRYVTMSGVDPKPANMIEYNNTGAGAISASLADTCTVASSAAEVAQYERSNLSTILGFTPAAE